jgi:hypothetical protein
MAMLKKLESLWTRPYIEAHRRGKGTSCTLSKDFKKLNHKNAIKRENRGPLPRFFHNPKYPPQNILKMAVHLSNHI